MCVFWCFDEISRGNVNNVRPWPLSFDLESHVYTFSVFSLWMTAHMSHGLIVNTWQILTVRRWVHTPSHYTVDKLLMAVTISWLQNDYWRPVFSARKVGHIDLVSGVPSRLISRLVQVRLQVFCVQRYYLCHRIVGTIFDFFTFWPLWPRKVGQTGDKSVIWCIRASAPTVQILVTAVQ